MYEKRKSDEVAASSDFLSSDNYCLWYIQQCKLSLPPFEQHGVAFPLVVAESDILPVDVPVARLQLSDQRAFGYLPTPQKAVRTDIVGKRGKEQLSQLHYYPNQRSVCPVKQIIIRD